MRGLNASPSEFNAENIFYARAKPHRLGKLLAHYELFKLALNVPGAIVECGVFKGNSFFRWAMMRSLFCDPWAKALIGFDTFSTYAYGNSERDAALRDDVVNMAGEGCIDTATLHAMLVDKDVGCDLNVQLVKGKVEETIPDYVKAWPELRISLLNLDLDFASGTRVALEHLLPHVVTGGIVLLDDYGVFEGASNEIDIALAGAKLRKFTFAYSPSYWMRE